MTDIPLRIVMSVAGGNALSGALGQFASSFGPAGVVGAALVGLGVSSVQAASTFQNAMLQNEAHAGLAASQVQAVNRALLQMGPAVGQGPTQLAEALYPILSGFSGITNQAAKTQVSLTELKLAAQSVAGSSTSVSTAAGAATAAFNALGLQTNNTALATQRMTSLFDIMNTTVSSGNMKWQDYANVAGKLATSIKGTSVSFKEANAALATMTNEGFSAQLSSHYLANLFTQLDIKTDSMAKHASKLGIAFDEQKFKTMSLAQQVEYLNKITHGNQSELLALLGGNATALKTFNALESGMKSYKGNLDALNHSHGATAQAFAVASSSYDFALKRLGASFQSLQISVGNIFLPLLTTLVNDMVPVVAGLADWIAANSDLSERIGNASTGLLPIVRKLDLVMMQLSLDMGYFVMHAATPVEQQFKSLALTTQNQLTPALQGTSSWMTTVGTPIYLAFAKVVRDILGGSFQQAGIDAKKMVATIDQSLAGLPAKIKGIKIPPINLGGTGSLGIPGLNLPSITQTFQPILDWLTNTFGPGWQSFYDNVLAPPIQAFQQIWKDVGPDFQDFTKLWESEVMPLLGGGKTKSGKQNVLDLGKAWKDLWKDIVPIVDFILEVQIQISSLTVQTVAWLGALGKQINDIATGAWKGITNAFSGAYTWWHNLWLSIDKSFSDTFSNLGNIAKGIWDGVTGGFKAGMNTLISGVNGLIDQLDRIQISIPNVGTVGINIPHIPYLAEGGHITSSGLALVGERGPELLNLPGGASVSPLTGGHTFNIYVSTMAGSPSEVRRLTQMIVAEMGSQFRLQSSGYNSGGIF